MALKQHRGCKVLHAPRPQSSTALNHYQMHGLKCHKTSKEAAQRKLAGSVLLVSEAQTAFPQSMAGQSHRLHFSREWP
eukprot:1157917-Pelagomonas_calceolata.AAC.1